jgi:TonB family protein
MKSILPRDIAGNLAAFCLAIALSGTVAAEEMANAPLLAESAGPSAARHVHKPARILYSPPASSFKPVSEPTLVQVRVCLDEDGQVQEASVLHSSDDALLDKGALRYARRHRFAPATVDGIPEASCVALPVVFSPPVRWKPPGFPGQIEALRGP